MDHLNYHDNEVFLTNTTQYLVEMMVRTIVRLSSDNFYLRKNVSQGFQASFPACHRN
jgi:hypothetical protein